MTAVGEDLIAFPEAQAARLARILPSRLRYWEDTYLIGPSIRRQLSPRNTVRLYGFEDLLSLLVVSELRTERDMSLQHIRRVVAHLKSRGYAAPLRELKFATIGKQIYFQHPDGTWEGDLAPDQIVLEKVLHLDPLRARISRAAGQRSARAGAVEKRRGVHASAPVFAGTRIRVATVQGYLQHGYDTAAILAAFPDLAPADVDQARRLLSAAG
jgi:DNA-binding transcriptional MerR regulator